MIIAWLKKHHIFHTWAAWSKPAPVSYNLYWSHTPQISIGTKKYAVQDRFCERCGVKQRRFLD